MGRFHEVLEEEHRKFAESLDGQLFFKTLSEMEYSSDYVLVEKQFLENLTNFDYWKEWKNSL
jgi:hypothetical protein